MIKQYPIPSFLYSLGWRDQSTFNQWIRSREFAELVIQANWDGILGPHNLEVVYRGTTEHLLKQIDRLREYAKTVYNRHRRPIDHSPYRITGQSVKSPARKLRPKRKGIGVKLRYQILRRDNYECRLCGRSAKEGADLEVDHIVPVARGGDNHPSNLWTLCFECNRGKGTLSLYALKEWPMDKETA